MKLTRAHREAIHREIREYCMSAGPLGDIEKMLTLPGRGVEACEIWAQVALSAKVLDAIGWDAANTSDTYEVDFDEDCIKWVWQRFAATKAMLEENTATLADVRAGRDPWAGYGGRTTATLAEDVAQVRELVDVDSEFAAACRAILNQLLEFGG